MGEKYCDRLKQERVAHGLGGENARPVPGRGGESASRAGELGLDGASGCKHEAGWVVMESSQVAPSPCSCKDKCFAFSLSSAPNWACLGI